MHTPEIYNLYMRTIYIYVYIIYAWDNILFINTGNMHAKTNIGLNLLGTKRERMNRIHIYRRRMHMKIYIYIYVQVHRYIYIYAIHSLWSYKGSGTHRLLSACICIYTYTRIYVHICDLVSQL